VKAPQIDIGKTPQEHLNIRHMLILPKDTPFGNMFLKHMKIIQRLDHVNSKLQNVYKDWQTITGEELNPSHDPKNHLLWIEEICYFLRVTTDELISLCYLFYMKRNSNNYPTNIKIHRIGKLIENLDKKEDQHYDFRQRFSESFKWLKIFNRITNAYKHSFMNSDLSIIGRDEPCVPVLDLPFSDLINRETHLYFIKLVEIIDGFNDFYQLTINCIRDDVWGGKE